MHLAAGDGIAFYHTIRAKFPPKDSHQRRPRISLIGTILDVEQNGQDVTNLRVQVLKSDGQAFRDHPVIRSEATEDLFRHSGMVRGAVASYYRVPAEVWSQFVALGRASERAQTSLDTDSVRAVSTLEPPLRVEAIVTRVVRDTPRAVELKKLYAYKCQLCDERLEVRPGVYYAEVHHIQPLGSPHDGPDVEANMLVLCPNHHAAFDLGAATFLSESSVQVGRQQFHLTRRHQLDDSVDYNNCIVAS